MKARRPNQRVKTFPMKTKINIRAARKLVKRYESFDPSKANPYNGPFLTLVSVKGDNSTCILCDEADMISDQEKTPKEKVCSHCIYGDKAMGPACYAGKNKPTYRAMENASSLKDLQVTMLARAAYIRQLVKTKHNIKL